MHAPACHGGVQAHGALWECTKCALRVHKCSIGMGARGAAGLPSLDMRQLLDYMCDIVIAVPPLARTLACRVLPRAAILGRLAYGNDTPQSRGQPVMGKVLGAFAEAMPEVRALEALQCCCMLPASGLHADSRGCWRSRALRPHQAAGSASLRMLRMVRRCSWSAITAMPMRYALAWQHGVPTWQHITRRIMFSRHLLASTVCCATEKSISPRKTRVPVLTTQHK